jgi:hypothetical protein
VLAFFAPLTLVFLTSLTHIFSLGASKVVSCIIKIAANFGVVMAFPEKCDVSGAE